TLKKYYGDHKLQDEGVMMDACDLIMDNETTIMNAVNMQKVRLFFKQIDKVQSDFEECLKKALFSYHNSYMEGVDTTSDYKTFKPNDSAIDKVPEDVEAFMEDLKASSLI